MKRLGGLVVAVFLVGCGSPENPSASSGTQPYEGEWQLTDGSGPEGPIPVLPKHPISLDIESARAYGTAACNNYDGAVWIDAESIKIVIHSVTDMACSRRAMEAEDAYLNALSLVEKVHRDDSTMILTGTDVRFRFALVPPAQLLGTRWELQAIIYGEGPEAMALEARSGYLVLRRDGTMSGSTGCRKISGDFTREGGDIILTSFATTDDCTSRLAEQDALVVSVLQQRFTPEIHRRGLELTSDHAEVGLLYSAPSSE